MSVLDVPGTIYRGIKNIPRKLFGTRNDRVLKRLARTADAVALLEPEMRVLCSEGDEYDAAFAARSAAIEKPADEHDAEAMAAYEEALQEIRVELSRPLRERGEALKSRMGDGSPPETEMAEAFAILREASRRARAHRHFDCQIVGGRVLYDGNVAEMRTGEGKTIVCHLPAFLKVLQGENIHVVTVNDYLVRRDADFARPIFELLGITVGNIQSQVDPGGREGIRRAAYACDITYGTTSEFGFDNLRDNMKIQLAAQVQGKLDFALIDEVDSILIDEARTPLIISGPAEDDVTRYPRANKVAEELIRRQTPWDRRVTSTVAKFDGETHGIPKVDDAMGILGHKERGLKKIKTDGDDASPGGRADDSDDEESKHVATLGPDFLSDDQVEAIQIYENDILKIPRAEQYRRFFIVQLERKQVGITHEGVTIAQDLLDMGSLYSGANMEWPHLIENALRAHKVYQRDRDYVVQNGEIIIVDPFTGRLMIGRQWSDGLHQAIEAKEHVRVKEESQTLATITIQNFFRLYKGRAGMTGTAMTEASEFMKIYKLDVIEVPTNRPINRVDHDDKLYRDVDAKYEAIVDEINEIHKRGRPADPYLMADVLAALRPIVADQGEDTSRIDEALRQFHAAKYEDPKVIALMLEAYDEAMGDILVGRPILVGTTSVENSEKLSKLLDRRYGIEHEVLNAKNHAREAEIVVKAGEQTVSTRGREKRLRGNVTIATNMAGRGTDIKLGVGVVYAKCKVPATLPDGVAPSDLYPPGVTKCCIYCEEYDGATNCAHCFKPKLDPRFPAMGRTVCTLNVPCGLHIIGTERHESRRIDNQLRGRSGRQGDPGSSRFSLSLRDDLLKLFMSDWMLKMMERMGFEEGGSLEDKRLSKGIERAQRKVEERNFGTRKHLLEWDEPMDFQRKEFYGKRQRILENRGLAELIFETIGHAISSAVSEIMGRGYDRSCIAEWCRVNLGMTIESDAITTDDLESAISSIREKARDEVHDMIRTSLGEYIDPEEPPSKWDVGGLLNWSQRLFKVALTQNQMRKMAPEEIENALYDAAQAHYSTIDLDGVALFLDPKFVPRSLAEWARSKFGIKIDSDDLAELAPDEVVERMSERVRERYKRREIEYPVDWCLQQAFAREGTDNAAAAEFLITWVNTKFRADWKIDKVQGREVVDIREDLVRMQESFMNNGRLAEEIAHATADNDPDKAITWAKERFGPAWHQRQFDEFDGELEQALLHQGRRMLRWELDRLEQMVLLQIYDQAWKDHLLEMDHLKHAIMQRPLGGDQSHPQSQFAIEGRDLFKQMWARISERVTQIIFRLHAGGGEDAKAKQSAATVSLMHGDATGAGFAGAASDRDAAMRAQGGGQKVATIRREEPRVKRNDPCPCGSGKKYKQCHGKKH